VTYPFSFLQAEWPAVYEAGDKAAAAVNPDPRTACLYARRALDLALAWAYKSDASLRLPYQDKLSAPAHEPTLLSVFWTSKSLHLLKKEH
jgi:type I restriction enzyme R subunit